MNGFYITVSNGLLTKEHRDRIGAAVWEFMWCLDKITRVDSKGYGWILGGKPINLADLAEQMGTSEDTTSRNLHRLEEQKYIEITRTPYGLVIKVLKAKKRFYKNAVSDDKRDTAEMPDRGGKNAVSLRNNAVSNKTVTVDKVVDKTIVASDEFVFEKELIKLKDNKRKDFKIIALYWKKKNWIFENQEQFNAALTRELRAAKSLKGYSGEQIARSIEFCRKEYPDIWTLETAFKRIQDLVNKKTNVS